MTQVERKLRKAGFGKQIESGKITIASAREVSVYVEYKDSGHNWDATERLANKVSKILGWRGFKTAAGEWIFSKDHVSNFPVMLDQLGIGAYPRK